MNCYFHNDVPAVSTCSVCGIGICSQCVDTSIHFEPGKNICRRCAPAKLEEANNDMKADRKSFSRRYRAMIFLMTMGAFMGLFVIVSAKNDGGDIEGAILGAVLNVGMLWGISGLLPTFMRPKSSSERVIDAVWLSSENGCAYLTFRFIFGIFLAPLNLYRMRKAIKNFDIAIENNNELLAQLNELNSQASN